MSLGLTGIELSREQWDHYCTQRVQDRVFAKRMDPGRAMREAHESMVRDYGPRPEVPEDKPQGDEAGAPWWLRVGVGLVGGRDMAKALKVILRFGPLVAAFALGLGAVLEPIVPGYTGIVTQVLSFLGVVGVGPDQDVVELVSALVAGVAALVGVARKVWSLVQAKYFPKP